MGTTSPAEEGVVFDIELLLKNWRALLFDFWLALFTT